MSCGSHWIRFSEDNKLVVTPDPIIIQNDSIHLACEWEMAWNRFMKNHELEFSYYLRAENQEQLLKTIALAPGTVLKGEKYTGKFNVAAPLTINLAQIGQVELQTRFIKPGSCNRLSIPYLSHFKSVVSLRFAFHHSGAMAARPNFLIYCDLSPHYDFYYIIRVKPKKGTYRESARLTIAEVFADSAQMQKALFEALSRIHD